MKLQSVVLNYENYENKLFFIHTEQVDLVFIDGLRRYPTAYMALLRAQVNRTDTSQLSCF